MGCAILVELALLVSATQVGKSSAAVVHDLVGAHDQAEEPGVHLHTGLRLVHVADLALFIASANVLSEELWVDGVHNLQRLRTSSGTYVEKVLTVRRPLEQVQVRQVHVEGCVGLHFVEDGLGCELAKVRHVDQTDLTVAESLK